MSEAPLVPRVLKELLDQLGHKALLVNLVQLDPKALPVLPDPPDLKALLGLLDPLAHRALRVLLVLLVPRVLKV